MTPGEGYLYYSNETNSKTFSFPKVKTSQVSKAAAFSQETLTLDTENNMTLIAVVKNDEFIVDNAIVSVYADGKLCGRSTAPVSGDKYFITVAGSNSKQMLSFAVETPQGSVQPCQMLTFEADSH